MSFVSFVFSLVVLAMAATTIASEDLAIVERAEWGAQPARDDLTPMELPLERAVIVHTAGASCQDDESCQQQVRFIQNYQMGTLHWSDIAYHFLIGDNGRIYEGRKPTQQGAFARNYNMGSLGIAFMGNFKANAPSEAALAAAQALLADCLRRGQLSENYQLVGHRQLIATESPGDALYAIIRKWPHFSG